MAGSVLAISTTNSQSNNGVENPRISATIDQWEVQYARFINYNSSTFSCTHLSLSPVPKNRLRNKTWISAAAASLKLIYQRSSNGSFEAVILISLQSRVVEEHYISKMHFSWPQVSCVSGFPTRGTKAVIVSYKDGVGQKQKFALQFLNVYEAEKFMNIVKEILENGSPPLLQSPEFNFALSSQAEVIPYDGPTHKNEGYWQCTSSVDDSTQLMISSSDLKTAPYSVSLKMEGDHAASDAMSVCPPSFTQLLKNCEPAAYEAKPKVSGDLKSQFMQYLEGTSFTELLATVESVINELGDADVL